LSFTPRVYVHAPYQPTDQVRGLVKQSILECITADGMAAQEFHVSGLARGDAWSMSRAIEVMRQCDGALIIALARRLRSAKLFTPWRRLPEPSEYSHLEGALALSRGLPTLVIAELGMEPRGILHQYDGNFIVYVPMSEHRSWVRDRTLLKIPATQEWAKAIHSRRDVFLGYCSKKSQLASIVKENLQAKQLTAMDWAFDFRPGRSIFDEIQRAAATCRCGLFLFTADDPIEGSDFAMPRDNVILEAGYFLSFAGPNRTLIAGEKGAKIPADLGGLIYATIEGKEDWNAASNRITDLVRVQLESDVR
jgi:hypothetical protein